MAKEPDKLGLRFGLLGKHIDYSFSRGYFSEKFKNEKLPYTYENFDVETVEAILPILESSTKIKGFNVTIPYKEAVIPLLDVLDKRAKAIGAVNTVRVTKQQQLIGYNTDFLGFKKSISLRRSSHSLPLPS